MNRAKRAWIVAGLIGLAAPAMAQTGLDGPDFFRALREEDNSKAVGLLQSRPSLINSRDVGGETALLITVSNRDDIWVGYLLSKGADPNLAARNGDTPLIAAARIGYLDAVEQLVAHKAKVDHANRMGETALIVAVQHRQAPVVRYLLDRGANPDQTDNAQGYSARDYAKRDPRAREIQRLIEAKKPAPASAASS